MLAASAIGWIMSVQPKITTLSDRDWDHLLTLAAGFLATTNGDIRRAMSKALAAHHDLITAAKQGAVSTQTPDGRITLVVPDSGGIALKLDAN